MLKRSTAFITLPIAALAAASLGVVLASLIIGASETDTIALARQRETIEHAISQHGRSLARELRAQTIWGEAYEKTQAGDNAWMRAFYGEYLGHLLGYDRIYVLDSNNKPVFAYSSNGNPNLNAADVAAELDDLIRAARNPQSMPDYDPVVTEIPMANGHVERHVAVVDARSVGDHPSTVVVSTILPDRGHPKPPDALPMLLVGVDYIDKEFTRQLGENFGFRDLQWVTHGTPAGDTNDVIRARNGEPVGTLVWRKDQPGLEFIRHVAPGLGLSLVLVGLLTYLLIMWGRRQIKRILDSEENAKLAARTDSLTALPNRIARRERLPRMLADAQGNDQPVAVLAIDIDDFKAINEAFGTTVGDAVLVACAQRLDQLRPPGAFIARPEGDHFTVLAPGLDAEAAREFGEDVITALAEPFDLPGGTRVFATASVGYAISPTDGRTGDDLLRRAELAVERAKDQAGKIAVAFAPEMDAEATYRYMLELALRNAVADGAISVFYQPLMDASGSIVVGVEALARWTDPTFGPVSPDIFIPLAEETGLIQNLGALVLRRAVEDGKAWPNVNVAVNVSASQIHHGDVVEVVREVLEESEFPAQHLEIEITESVLLADERRANEQMRGLQALGVKVALDDFGTGYSGLQYLRRFGFDKLKIDRSFIDGAGEPQDNSIVLASIIKLGQDLSLTITAEGVETVQQQRWLQQSGCHQLQGYLFSRPIPADQMTAFIAAHTRHNAVAS